MLTKLKKRIYTFCKLLVISLVLVGTNACQDNENNNIPLVEVNFQRNLNEPDLLNLQTIGGSVMVSGGSRGIILFRVSSNEIKAFDRHCTFQPSDVCAIVTVDANGFTATDACCGSSFLLNDGSVTSPPASIPLKQYSVFIDNNTVFVSN